MATSKLAVLEAEFGVQITVTGSGREWTARAAKDGDGIDEATGTSRVQALEVLADGLAAWALNGHPTLAEVVAERESCGCGCGAYPVRKRSRFLPGHDARLASRLRKAGVTVEQLPPDETPDGTIREVVRVHGSQPGRVNAAQGHQSPSRRRAAQGDTSRIVGSEA